MQLLCILLVKMQNDKLLWKSLTVCYFILLIIHLTYDSAISPLGIWQNKINICIHEDLHMNVHGRFICNSHILEITLRSSLGMNKQTVVYLWNGTLLSHKNEQIINILNNMDESQNNFSECKMQAIKQWYCIAFI